MRNSLRVGPAVWLVTAALAAIGCKGTEPSTTGTLQVTVVTVGRDFPVGGYSVEIDSAQGVAGVRPIAVNGAVTFSGLNPGTYTVSLNNTGENCPVFSFNPQPVSVTVGQTADVAFQVKCLGLVDVPGVWNYTAQGVCNDTGSFVVTQSGSIISGNTSRIGTCDFQNGSVDHSFSGPVTGQPSYSPDGAFVSFSAGGCTYRGEVLGTPADRLEGSVDCGGTWTAVRGGGPIASVAVSPPAPAIVAGGTARLRAVLADSTGTRRVDPTVTWSSDAPGIATVDSSGVVSGVAPGTATITATAEAKRGTATVGVEVVTFATVQAGAYHSCGLATSGAAYCWGNGTYGQVGAGTKANGLAPVAVANGLTFTSITVGAVHSCGLTAGGTAYCWGSNATGELGAGTLGGQQCGSEPVACVPFPIAVVGGHEFSSVSAGWGTSCALTPSGTAYCWGGDTYGQLGDRSTTGTSTPVPVTGGLTFVSTGVGVLSACGLTAAGAAYCWGNNSVGQLGIGAASPETCGGGQEPCSSVPVAVSGGLTFTALSVGYFHACGLTSDGSAYCWGDNGNGQLGATTTEGCVLSDGTVPCSTSPVPVEGGLTFAKLSAGYFHSCGVTAAGDGYCWGANDQDQLGNGTATSGATPAPIAGGLTFTALSAFGRYHSCGLSTASIAYCWGSNYWGQVGAGTGSSTPVPVIGQAAATAPAPARTAQTSRAGARIAVPRISARPPRP